MKKKAVIGIGNPLRQDDGIGIILIHKLLKDKHKFPPNIDFIDGGTGGMNLIHTISKYNLIIFIDAVNFNGPNGESRLFEFKEINNKKVSVSNSTHSDNILKVIELSIKLFNKPKKFLFFGIKPFKTNFGNNLSKELYEKVDAIYENLIKELIEVLQ
ncbi:hydrogenase maturation protease [Candidatus Woesearchaeota archaeon]|nr:hydrogenase maturation protease [Candidatus Woesearchaeota archaeon]